MVRKRKVYYCERCKKWCGTNKECPECKGKTVERELPKARGDYYFIDGIDKPLPRVTSILKVLNKPGLGYWKAKTAAQAALANPTLSVTEAVSSIYQKRDKAGATGSDVHKIIEKISKGEKVDEQTVSKIPQIQAYRKFRETVPHKVLESEMVVYSEKFGYAGTLDALIQTYSTAIVQGKERAAQAKKAGYKVIKEIGSLNLMRKYGKVWLIDFKTNNHVYAEHFLQISAYKNALQEMRQSIKIDGLAIIHLKKDGNFAFIEAKDDFDVFLAALKIFNWTK